jgi:hypothetical protein
LLNNKREERQAALASALALADEHAKHRVSTHGYGSEPLRQAVQSSVSVVTGTGGIHLSDGASGLASGTGVVTAAGEKSARKRLVFISAVAATFLLGIGVVAAISGRSSNGPAKEVPATSAAASQLPAPVASVAPPVPSASNSGDEEVKRPADSEVPAATSVPADETPGRTKARSTPNPAGQSPPNVTRRENPPMTSPVKLPTTSPPPKTWNKQDPGF